MNRTELEKIIENLDTVFRGDAWHGPSVMEFINSMPISEVAKRKPYSKHTICEIIYHLTAWRKYAYEKLSENIHYDVISHEENYGSEMEVTQENWTTLVANLKDSQQKLLNKLEEFDDSLLKKLVPGNDYDFYKLLTGIIQHDTYHLGMIWVLWE